jgi:hypothetical protein
VQRYEKIAIFASFYIFLTSKHKPKKLKIMKTIVSVWMTALLLMMTSCYISGVGKIRYAGHPEQKNSLQV